MKLKETRENPRWWDLPAALILVVALFLSALRLSATNWTDELDIVQTIVLLATVLGLALGQSLFSRRQVVILAALYGIFIITWQMGTTFGSGIYWGEVLNSLFGRLQISFENLYRQRAVTDPVLFLFLMSLLFWILSAYSGYTLTRHANGWQAALPPGIALFIIHIHDPFWTSRSWFLAGYIFLALVLLSRLTFLKRSSNWKLSQTHMPPYAGLDFLRATMFAGGLLILLAWTAPALAAAVPPAQQAWQVVSRPYYQARARVSNAFASLRATVGIVQDYYGDVLPLGRGNTLTDVVVFTVEAPPRPDAGVRYYWRARVYDSWTGSQWLTEDTIFQNLTPDSADLVFPNLEGRWEANFVFRAGVPLATVYSVPQPQWVSRPVSAELLPMAGETVEIMLMQSTPSIRPGEVYEVQSALTNVTTSQLQASGTDYPAWVEERYLELPDSVTARTLDLAEDIAGDLNNPYDITEAITQWMRENIAYNDTLPVPPPGQDIIDWMLFDLNQGFCNYYATAEIIMLRHLGIPARLAVGYAQGQRDPDTNTYTVRQRDAHAWPEVFFPEIGWVEFEPTLNQRPLRRPVGDPVVENDDGSADIEGGGISGQPDLEALLGFEEREDQPILGSEELGNTPGGLNGWIWVLIPGVLILTFSGIAWYRSRVEAEENPITPIPVQIEKGIRRFGLKPPHFIRRWAYQAGLPIQAKAYLQLNKALVLLGNPPSPDCTPAERAANLSTLLPTSQATIQVLLDEYQALIYTSSPGSANNPRIALIAARTIRSQTWREIFRRIFARFQEPEKRQPLV